MEAYLPFFFGGPAIWFWLCGAGRRVLPGLSSYALKSARRFEAILSLLSALGIDVLLTRGILSLKEPESKSVASLKSFKPWSMLAFLSVLSTLSVILTADGRKTARKTAWLRTIPIPLLGRIIFVHWVPCRIWRIIIQGRKTEYKNSESNPVLDDNTF